MQRSSPDWSSGLSRFEASTVAPWAEPAPRMVWISSMKRIGSSPLAHGGHQRLEARFEVAAVLGAGQQRAHVEGVDLGVAEALGGPPLMDALREPFREGGLSDAALAHEDGVVLAAPRQHVDGAFDLGVAADQRVETTRSGKLAQIGGEYLERIGRGPRPLPPRLRHQTSLPRGAPGRAAASTRRVRCSGVRRASRPPAPSAARRPASRAPAESQPTDRRPRPLPSRRSRPGRARSR